MSHYRPRFVEGLRWLRSDGKPNFSSRVYRVESDLERLATRPVVMVTPTTPILKALEAMVEYDIRSVVVADSKRKYHGMMLSEHVVDYLGGGERYNLLVNSFENDFYKAINAPVSLIHERDYPAIEVEATLTRLLEFMMREGLSITPVLDNQGLVYGIVSEHDIVRLISQKHTGVPVGDVMTPSIPTVESEASLREAMVILIRTRLRGVFVSNEVGQVLGLITSKDIAKYIGSHKAFNHVKKGYVEDFTSVPVKELARYNIVRVKPDTDVGDLAWVMIEKKEPMVLVVDSDDTPAGMVTEHDVFYALALPVK